MRHIPSDGAAGARCAGGGISRSKQSGMVSLVIFEVGIGFCGAAGLANGQWIDGYGRGRGLGGKVWDDG